MYLDFSCENTTSGSKFISLGSCFQISWSKKNLKKEKVNLKIRVRWTHLWTVLSYDHTFQHHELSYMSFRQLWGHCGTLTMIISVCILQICRPEGEKPDFSKNSPKYHFLESKFLNMYSKEVSTLLFWDSHGFAIIYYNLNFISNQILKKSKHFWHSL